MEKLRTYKNVERIGNLERGKEQAEKIGNLECKKAEMHKKKFKMRVQNQDAFCKQLTIE